MWYYIISLLVIVVIGVISLFLNIRSLTKEHEEGIEYINTYREYCESIMKQREDYGLYQKLTMNAPLMQEKVGSLGIAQQWIPPFSQFAYSNFQLIVNLLPEIRRKQGSLGGWNSLMDEEVKAYISTIDEVLLRYLGVLDKRHKYAVNNIKNPFIWLREGVQFFVQLPISVLYWSGLIRYATYNFLTRNFFIKILNLLIIIIGLASSVVTIVTGYNPFMDIFAKWIKR
ncbi:hypothetical protein [Paenibacillus turpanensis]|uniref:hypothetical protein n=1 Tax=Paenibacillus turpanensis TaxID=2689078 RepID=UPI00140A1A0F|nr:hypothetical protein [Paenibacillus turpanensis]